MKKLIYCAAALATALFAGSCQQELLDTPAGENTVTYTVEVPGVATKAIADGKNVDYLFYEVYVTTSSTADDLSNATLLYKKDDIRMVQSEVATSRATVTLNLVQNQHYTVLFWAQCGKKSEGVYDVDDLRAVTYKDAASIKSNHEDYAAFYAVDVISDSTPRAKKVYLKRPFAQLNIGTLNTVDYDKDPYTVNMIQSKVTVKQVPTVFNVATSEVDLDSVTDFTFAWETLDLISDEQLAVNDKNYHYVAMNYMFAGIEGRTAKVEYELEAVMTTQGNVDIPVELSKYVVNVPLKENYRTNIVGNLLTSSTEYEVIVDAAWAGEDLALDPLYLAAANGGEVTLTEDVVLTMPLEVNSEMTINLNGKTISGEFVKGHGAVVKIADGASVILNGGTIENTAPNGDAAINNEGTLVLNGVTIEGAPLADGGYSAYAVVSSGNMVIEEGTAISADRGSIKVNGAGETVINGGTFTNNDIDSRALTSHVVDVEDGSTHKLTINGGTFQHLHAATSGGVVICNRTTGTVYVNGGNFSGGNYYGNDNLYDYGYGGTFSVKGGVFSANPAAKYIAAGYKSISASGNYYVLPEAIADAAVSAGVTTVTESTADVATALATNNGEATMFMWNDVAYIAKNGEVIITSSAEEATTVRGVVESAAGLTSATVAEGIEVVGNRTFRKCANLETVVFPNTLTEIGPAVFQSCSKLANVTIPASVKTIGEGAFAECTSLTSINIPAGVTRIEADALRATGLVSVEFHEGVTYFGAQAFRDCKQLKEVYINAPEFTVEANAFGVMAGALPGTTIYVANAEMKAYLESTLAYKNQFTIVAPTVPETGAAAAEALKNGENVSLASDLTFSADETPDTGYGKAGLNVNGSVLNGNGHTITANDAWKTWDCTISAVSGTIKNVTVKGAMRGIFMPGANGDVYIDNVTFDNVIYTFNSDAGNKDYGVYISDSTLNGWTSFSDCHKEVVFTNCSFGEGNGYAFCRPYNACVFENCEFSTDMEFDTTKQANIVFKNCTYGGVKITAENAASLKTGDVTFFYNGVGSVTFE